MSDTPNDATEARRLQDEVIIKKHDPGVRGRAYIELQIVNKLLDEAAAAGYTLVVQEYEAEGEKDYDVKEAIFNLDEALVVVNYQREHEGWIKLTMGNGGYDMITDYSRSLEEFLEPVNAVADWWGR